MSGNKLFTLFLLGAILLIFVDSAKSSRQRDVVEESCEEDDNGDMYDADGKPRRVGAQRPLQRKEATRSDDDWDGVEVPTDEDYLRYENTNQEGICLLERGKCPAGDWKMFKRGNVNVCLKVVGRQFKFDGHTGGQICRAEANARPMTVDSYEERKWIYSQPLGGNGTSGYLLIAGYRNRECQMNPYNCKDLQTAFNSVDGTSDHKYIYSKWTGLLNRYTYGYLDDCLLSFVAPHPVDWPVQIVDSTCHESYFNTVLCGVTVM